MTPLAVSLGDPAGIGPEIIAESWARRGEGLPPFFVMGGAGLLAAAARQRGLHIPIRQIDTPAEACCVFAEALPVLGALDDPYRPGLPDTDGARLALASLTARLVGLVGAPFALEAFWAVVALLVLSGGFLIARLIEEI